MNDFTKEELEDISSCIDVVQGCSTISEMTYGALQEKIQSMIDDYCEHEFEYKDIGRVKICGKCERIGEFK